MIVVTGATGRLGRAVVTALLARVAPERVGVSVRNAEKAADLASRGVRVRAGDFAAPEGLEHAFEGATQLLLVSSNASAYGGDPPAQHRAAIAAARSAGVERIVYTSHMAASATSAFPPMHDHAATEQMLRESGMPWTALRNGFYAASAVALMGDALTTGVLEAPADGAVSWTTHADPAGAAALVLTQAACFDGPTPPLLRPESLDMAGLARIASELSGREVRRQVQSEEELRSRMAARGAPARAVDITLGLFAASRNGEFSGTDTTLERLLQRRPASMREVIAETMRG